jgi:hypothetical protein
VLRGGAFDGPRRVMQDGAQQLVLREVDDPRSASQLVDEL